MIMTQSNQMKRGIFQLITVAALAVGSISSFAQQTEKDSAAPTPPNQLSVEKQETDLDNDGKPDLIYQKYKRADAVIMDRMDNADGSIIYQIFRENQMVLFLKWDEKASGYTLSFSPGLRCRVDIKSGNGNAMERIILMEGNKFLEEFYVDGKGNVTPLSEETFQLQISGRRSIEDGRILRRRGRPVQR